MGRLVNLSSRALEASLGSPPPAFPLRPTPPRPPATHSGRCRGWWPALHRDRGVSTRSPVWKAHSGLAFLWGTFLSGPIRGKYLTRLTCNRIFL